MKKRILTIVNVVAVAANFTMLFLLLEAEPTYTPMTPCQKELHHTRFELEHEQNMSEIWYVSMQQLQRDYTKLFNQYYEYADSVRCNTEMIKHQQKISQKIHKAKFVRYAQSTTGKSDIF